MVLRVEKTREAEENDGNLAIDSILLARSTNPRSRTLPRDYTLNYFNDLDLHINHGRPRPTAIIKFQLR